MPQIDGISRNVKKPITHSEILQDLQDRVAWKISS